ncbi:MBG domain-containing protein, partial [Salinimicrobium oceani]
SLDRAAGETVAGSPYAIGVGNLSAGTNYSIDFTSADFAITARPITITPDVGQSKYCGQDDPVLTYTSSKELIAGNSFTGSLGREEGEGVGFYTYTLGDLSAGDNYSLTLGASDKFEIKGVTIDASASSTAQPLGSTNSPLSALITDQNDNPVSDASVTFYVYNSEGSLLGTKISDTGSNGVAATTFDASSFAIGVYAVKAVAGSGCAESFGYLTIYDPNSDFVTGGGWINSPEGAYVADPSLSGKANFGFVAKYKKGRADVDGNTEFQFKAGDFNFKSSFHNSGSLVVSGAKATYRGEGTVNGTGQYGFMVSAYDGAINGSSGGSDKFRIKIWNISTGNAMVYDNKYGALENADISGDLNLQLGGGSIVIHQAKGGGNQKAQQEATVVQTFEPVVEILTSMSIAPNPVRTEALVRFSFGADATAVVEVFDFSNRKVANLFNGKVSANQGYEVTFNRDGIPSGSYFIKVTASNGQTYTKQIIVD